MFTLEPDHRGGYSWHWQFSRDGGSIHKSSVIHSTLWGCVSAAKRAGFDNSVMAPVAQAGSFVVEIANRRKDI
jgi:hypothetical protein